MPEDPLSKNGLQSVALTLRPCFPTHMLQAHSENMGAQAWYDLSLSFHQLKINENLEHSHVMCGGIIKYI